MLGLSSLKGCDFNNVEDVRQLIKFHLTAHYLYLLNPVRIIGICESLFYGVNSEPNAQGIKTQNLRIKVQYLIFRSAGAQTTMRDAPCPQNNHLQLIFEDNQIVINTATSEFPFGD